MKQGLLAFLAVSLMSVTSVQAKTSSHSQDIKFDVTKKILVLPTSLENKEGQPPATCNGGGVWGPRIRMVSKIAWLGQDMLLPMMLTLDVDSSNLDSRYSSTITPMANAESFSYMFADAAGNPVTTDYLVEGVYQTSGCFFDFGGLPFPLSPIKGTDTLVVPAKVTLSGIIRSQNGEEKYFSKEINAEIIYAAGSVPVYP